MKNSSRFLLNYAQNVREGRGNAVLSKAVVDVDRIMRLPYWSVAELSRSQAVEKMAFPRKLWTIGPTLCAFANATGGVLALGILPNGTVRGFGMPRNQHFATFDDIKRRFERRLRSLLVGSLDMAVRWELARNEQGQDDYVALIGVKASKSRDVTTQRNRRAYMRVGSRNVLTAVGLSERPANYDSASRRKEDSVMDANIKQGERKPYVFVSHSSKDKAYADEIVKLLRGIGLSSKNLIYTSNPNLGVPVGKDIFDFLKNCFTDYDLYVFFIISKNNYYESPVCLNEMGAAWVVGGECCPILLPGMSFENMKGVLSSNTSAISLERPTEVKYRLRQIRDQVLKHVGLSAPDDDRWEELRDEFLTSLNYLKP